MVAATSRRASASASASVRPAMSVRRAPPIITVSSTPPSGARRPGKIEEVQSTPRMSRRSVQGARKPKPSGAATPRPGAKPSATTAMGE